MTDFLSAENARIHALGGKFSDNWGMPGNSTLVFNSENEMLTAIAVKGDLAVRLDVSKTFRLRQLPASNIANWQELLFTSYFKPKDVVGKEYRILPSDHLILANANYMILHLPPANSVKHIIKIINVSEQVCRVTPAPGEAVNGNMFPAVIGLPAKFSGADFIPYGGGWFVPHYLQPPR